MGNPYVFVPEILLIATALGSALLGFVWARKPVALWLFALVGVVVAMFITFDMMGLGFTRALNLPLWPSPVGDAGDFSQELRIDVDEFALFFHTVFLLVALLAILASLAFLRGDEPHKGEYYCLMILAVVGMMFAAAATDLFVLFLAFEVASLSTFALTAYRKKDRQGTEAAVKFFIIGAVSTALVLFGISLVYGIGGTTDLYALKAGLSPLGLAAFEPALLVALVFLIAGFGFKVAVVPFHMWAPDVYQGSPTTISAFLSAGSKMVGVVALLKVFLIGLLGVAIDWVVTLAILSIVTQTVGNVLAIPQRSVKRMLAYSSISQAGYILIALPVGALALVSTSPDDTAARVAVAGLVGGLFQVLTYAATKAGTFLVVGGLQARGVSDEMDSYRGLGRRTPYLAFSMTILLLSLAGIPPLGGFFSKFFLFSSAVYAAEFNPWYLTLAISGVLNSALSLYYYARVIWYIYILEPLAEEAAIRTPRSIGTSVLLPLVLMLVIVLPFVFAGLFTILLGAAESFFQF